MEHVVTQGLKTIIFPVKDITKAKDFYRALLGVEPSVDQPYYVGFDVGGQHVGLDPNGHKDGAVGYWHVADIRKRLAALTSAGAKTLEGIKDVGGGRLIASAKDADGNLIGLAQDA
jgi:predicted enzyme related to lactoylglutathione lyase